MVYSYRLLATIIIWYLVFHTIKLEINIQMVQQNFVMRIIVGKMYAGALESLGI